MVYYDIKLKPETCLLVCHRVSLFPRDNEVKIILVSRLLLVPFSRKLGRSEHRFLSSICVHSHAVLNIKIVSAVCEVFDREYLDKEVPNKSKFQDTVCVKDQKRVNYWSGLTDETFTLLKKHHLCKCWWHQYKDSIFMCFLLTYLLSYLLTYYMARVLVKLTGSQLIKKFPTFYGTWRFITTFKSTCHLSLSSARLIQSMPLHPTSWRSIIILSSHLWQWMC